MSSHHSDGAGALPDRTSADEPATAAGISRRLFLKRSAAVLVSGLVASRLGGVQGALAHDGAHAEPGLAIWGATKQGERYLALAGSGEDPAIHELHVDGQDGVTLGSPVGASLPDGFVALALLATGNRLLVAGGGLEEADRLTIDYRSDDVHPEDREALPEGTPDGVEVVPVFTLRPALYEVVDGAVKELPLGAQVRVAYGAATAIAARGVRHLTVTIEGSDDIEQAYNAVTRVAESADGGDTWTASVVDADLGEGLPSHVVATDARLLAVTVDGEGTRRFHERMPGGDWRPAPADGADGPVLALVAAGGDAALLVDRSSGAAQRKRREGGSGWQTAGPVDIGEEVLDVVAVSGSRGEVVAIGQSSARLLR